MMLYQKLFRYLDYIILFYSEVGFLNLDMAAVLHLVIVLLWGVVLALQSI